MLGAEYGASSLTDLLISKIYNPSLALQNLTSRTGTCYYRCEVLDPEGQTTDEVRRVLLG